MRPSTEWWQVARVGLLCAMVVVPIWVMTPFDFDKFGEIKFQLTVLVAVTGAAAFAWWGLAGGGFGVTPSVAVWLLGLMVVQALLASMLSTDPVRAVTGSPIRYDGFIMALANAAFFLLGYRIATGDRARVAGLVAKVMVVAALPVWAYALTQALRLDPIRWEQWRVPQGRVFSTLGNPIFLGAFSIMAVVVALALALDGDRRSRYLWSASAGFGTAVVVFTAARASWIALAGGLVLIVALGAYAHLLRRLALVSLVAGLVAAGAVGVSVWKTPEVHAPLLSSSVAAIAQPEAPRNSGREAIWAISLRIIADHPALGVGLDEMDRVFDRYRTEAFDRSESSQVIADKPHSSVLEWAVETGVPGMLLFVGVVATILVTGLRRFRRGAPFRASWSEVGLWLAAAVYFAQSLVTVTAIGVDGVWWLVLGVVAAPALVAREWTGTPQVAVSWPALSALRGRHQGRILEYHLGMRRRAEHGFTLIELLVVIIVIAILAAIAIPVYFGAREKAQDAAAVTLVRNALTVVEGVRIDLPGYDAIVADDLREMESTIAWTVVDENLIDEVGPTITDAVASEARTNAVDFYGESTRVFDIATISESGNRYGIQVETTAGGTGTSYVKVKVIDGTGILGW